MDTYYWELSGAAYRLKSQKLVGASSRQPLRTERLVWYSNSKTPSVKSRFSIRDLLWLTALAAVLVAWWVDRSRLAVDRDNYKHGMEETINAIPRMSK